MGNYVLLDAMGIQSYIFQTNTLKIILGASYLLANWQKACEQMVEKSEGRLFTSAGGNVLAWFNTEEKALEFKSKAIEKCPPGLSIAWAITDDSATDREIWNILQKEIARFKAGDRDAIDYLEPVSLARPGCLHCGIRPSDGGGKIDNRKICSTCRTLYDKGGNLGQHNSTAKKSSIDRLYDLPEELGLGVLESYPVDLKEMVKRPDSDVDDLMAVVVVDLNDMGNRVKQILLDGDFNRLKDFSQQLETDYCDLFRQQITAVAKEKSGVSEEMSFIRVRPLMLGGDDAVFALPAPLWPQFVTDVLRRLSEKEYPACAGVVVAKHNFPINRLVMMAEELIKNAKSLCRYRGEKSAIDWYVHQESAFTNPLEVRKRNFYHAQDSANIDFQDFHSISTRKPYELGEFEGLLAKSEEIMALSSRKKYSLYQALRQGPLKTRQVLKYVFFRDETEKLDKYSILWEEISSQDSDFPLWEKMKAQNGDNETCSENYELYHSCWPDIIELSWMIEDQQRR